MHEHVVTSRLSPPPPHFRIEAMQKINIIPPQPGNPVVLVFQENFELCNEPVLPKHMSGSELSDDENCGIAHLVLPQL